jgi:hypothetical protein
VARLLVFAGLGPPLGLLTGIWGILPILNWALGQPTSIDLHQVLALIPMVYVVGILPACLAGLFDGLLAQRGIRWRIFLCALFGFALSFLPLLS